MKVIEAKQVNEFGEYTSERVISPQRWYEMFQKNLQKETEPPGEKFEIPESRFKTPGRIMQFITYFNRNLLNKIADRQYALFALLISPILAVILGFFTKYVSGSNSNFREYMFINNVNLPAYIFMSVIVALFIGLIISAEEIIKDKKILERERFLNLSRISYINSKVVFLFILGAIQMILFVIISNRILEIKEMKLDYWLVLFSTSCFAIMLGLNISSSLKSVIAIYINIPFILVPLILLSGVIVKYDKMNYRISSNQYVPFVGDMMASRWGYEALTVAQFKNNKYQQYFYSVESKTANISYELNFLLPAVQNKIDDYERLLRNEQDSNKINQTIHIIRNSLSEIAEFTQIKQPELFTDQIRKELNLESIQVFLKKSRNLMILKNKEIEKDKDEIFQRFRDQGMTNSDITSLKERYFNRSISDVVLNTNEMNKIFESGDRFVRKDSPIYQIPSSKTGRSQFYAGTKLIGKYKIDTMWFNIMVLWTMTIILYLVLISNVLNKIFKKYSYSVKRTKR